MVKNKTICNFIGEHTLTILVPDTVVQLMNLKLGDDLDFYVDNEKLVIEKSASKKPQNGGDKID